MDAMAQSVRINDDTPIVDLARVVPAARLPGLQLELKDLERETGWRVRMLTSYGAVPAGVEDIRRGWHVDERTAVVFVDPSNPNIMSFNYGMEVQGVLSRPFFTELQSRYGNLFTVREIGESAAVVNMLEALTGCLRKGGCAVVPGLPSGQYFLTLYCAIAGGFVAGFASTLQPEGLVRRRWVWLLIFAPLWGTLFINFGLGPILMRTSDMAPVLGNTVAFMATASFVKLVPNILGGGGAIPAGPSQTTDDD